MHILIDGLPEHDDDDAVDPCLPMLPPPLCPTPEQKEAINEMIERAHSIRGAICIGKTGSGKTLVGYEALAGLAASCPQERRPFVSLAVVPSQGGEVIEQWVQCAKQQSGDGITIVKYTGPSRDRTSKWKAMKDSDHVLVITTAETILADTEHKTAGIGVNSPIACCPFGAVVVDEAHSLRGGSPPHRQEEVDVNKKKYAALNRWVMQKHSDTTTPVFFALTATPFRNTAMDVYSLVRFLDLPDNVATKLNWLQRSEDKKGFREIKKVIAERVCVQIKMKEPPPTIQHVCMHTITGRERVAMTAVNDDVAIAAARFLEAARRLAERDDAQTKREHKLAYHACEAQLTSARRGVCHAALYAHRSAPIDPEAVAEAWPLCDCSKMLSLVDLLSTTLMSTNPVVFSYFTDVLRIAKVYIERAIPGRLVVLFHGKCNTRAAMQSWRTASATGGNPILLATRGSMGEGVSIPEATVVVNIDMARSDAEAKQNMGRVKRPLKQEGVTEWHAYQLHAKTPVIVNPPANGTLLFMQGTRMSVSSGAPNIDDFYHHVQELKQAGAADMFMSSSERKEAENADEVDPTQDLVAIDGQMKTLVKMLHYYELLTIDEAGIRARAEAREKKKQAQIASARAARARKRARQGVEGEADAH